MNSRWHEALDSQSRAFAFYDSPDGRRYARGWADSWGPDGELVHSSTGQPVSEEALRQYRTIMDTLPDAILAADTIYVESEMWRVAQAAVQSFQSDTIHAIDLPTQRGYLYLPEPLIVKDRHDVDIAVRVLIWFTTPEGVVLYLMHRIGDRDGYTDKTLEKQLRAVKGVGPDDLMIVHVFPVKYGWDLPGFADLGVHGTPGEVLPTLLVLWRLMQQTIATATRERPPRMVRRRTPPPLVENLVTVVRLRRPHKDRDPADEAQTVDWAHRWIVSGHWRWQPYPSLGGVRKQIWISPYLKGPEDKPLMVRRARVLNLAR